MRQLLNTLYIFTEDAYLALDGKNVVVQKKSEELGRIPLHTLESIVCFTYAGASPYLMGACAENGIQLSFFTPGGRYLAGSHGRQKGNVLLRKRQYRISDDSELSLAIARNCIMGKVYNAKWVVERATRDHGLRIDKEAMKATSASMSSSLGNISSCDSHESLRGLEGDAASVYFAVFDEMILRDKEAFRFNGRNRRPPTDPVNAMLSLFYTVLANDCATALEGVGLDPYVGFLHVDRPGRKSLALDMMEELRAPFVDRFVLASINNRVIDANGFCTLETGEVRIDADARKKLFTAWQERKREVITHPFLKEKMPRGLVPHVQSLLLTRHLRGDLDGYPPFLWK